VEIFPPTRRHGAFLDFRKTTAKRGTQYAWYVDFWPFGLISCEFIAEVLLCRCL
jgi:hypothetical protein